MSYSIAPNDRQSVLNEKIRLIKLRKEGFDPQQEFEQRTLLGLHDLRQKTQAVAEELIPRIQETKDQVTILTDKVIKAVDDEIQLAQDNEKRQQLKAMQDIRKRCTESLLAIQADLAAKKQQNEELLNMLEALRKKMDETPILPFENVLQEVGDRTSYRIATGRNKPSPIGKGDERFEKEYKK